MSTNVITVKGKTVDHETRCIHYHSPQDIIAIKFKCCKEYYPCYYCHQEEVNHKPEVWSKNEFDVPAILCGSCRNELTISEYLISQNVCTNCGGRFNPNCRNHYQLYFEI